MFKRIAAGFFVLIAFAGAHSQGWRGVVPLHSSCEEAQRILGITGCENQTYDLHDARVSITFSDGTCLSEWKVDRGTVLTLDVRPKPAIKLVDLRLDYKKYRKVADRHDPNIVYYRNSHEGVSVVVLGNGMVAYLSYGASAQDEYLRCPTLELEQEESGGDSAFWKTDEYGHIGSEEENSRLAEFALRLKQQPKAQAYVIAYGGKTSWPDEAKVRSTCAKDYLVKTLGIDGRRIATVDGGYQDEAVVELYIGVAEGVPPTPSPTVDPSKVRIIKDQSPKDYCCLCRVKAISKAK